MGIAEAVQYPCTGPGTPGACCAAGPQPQPQPDKPLAFPWPSLFEGTEGRDMQHGFPPRPPCPAPVNSLHMRDPHPAFLSPVTLLNSLGGEILVLSFQMSK
ncbi:Hypothetical predicted protein [Marmota monax]|uniref:Uncharacterized protein n=1 Tax=Marmota monax TaxID=9995 RepID=A0A5E4APD1_MARMO|nr:hypothetical protein GHT09_019758 [Marmota monax]VTJ59005.1 Hypothetical predicted protein [Marmota monax]